MSEFVNAAFIFGAIGAFTGTIAIAISFLNYNFQKPNLKIKVKNCSHLYQKSELLDREIRFLSLIEIRNCGDRGTNISEITLSFRDNEKEYLFEDQIFGRQTKSSDNWGRKITQVEYRWINPSETIVLNPILVNEFNGQERDEIKCTFTIVSTRKNYTKKFTSKKNAKFPK